MVIYAADSSEPDNDSGHVGRAKFNEIRDFFGRNKSKVKVFALHHHLIPVPHTGREHNVVEDAGDVLGVLKSSGCSLVLNGHRHVPWMWQLGEMVLYNTGTLLSRRVRGGITQLHTRIEITTEEAVFTLCMKDGSERPFAKSPLTAQDPNSLMRSSKWIQRFSSVVTMEVSEEFVKLCGQVGSFTRGITGVSVVDAYFGPEEFDPELQEFDGNTQSLRRNLRNLADRIREEVDLPLRQEYMIGEVESMVVVVDWLKGEKMNYPDLVQGLFGIAMKRFDDSTINDCIASLESEIEGFPGADLREKVTNFTREGEVTGEELRELVEGELQKKSSEVGQLFRERVFSKLGEQVQDNGVLYEAVTDKPWSGYNWYQGGFKSLNQFNVDNTFNTKTIRSVIYHEYEHHVSNLWRERNFLDTGNPELSIVPLHTGRCVISEGTADTAKDFLGVEEDDPAVRVMTDLYRLRRITSINAAIMLNHDGRSEEEAVEYMVEKGYRTQKTAKSSVRFIGQTTEDGRVNFWAPYIFTYFIGRQDFVFPTFLKAKEEGELRRFFTTVYQNPYSGSSLTWHKAFDWLQ